MTQGTKITAASFKTIQDKAETLLGTGSASQGYGQTVISTEPGPGTNITKAQWDSLRFDIINIRVHQDGVLPPIVAINVGDVISFGSASPNSNFNTILDQAIANKFSIGPGRATVSSIITRTFSSSWLTSATCTLTATFANANEARYFFNSGGKIRISGTRSGGSISPQNNAWTNLLNTVGIQEFGAGTDPTVNFYTLTNSYQTYYTQSSTTPYSANNYILRARCNVANNSSGTATVVEIEVNLNDSHTGPVDAVDGTLSIIFEELKASGSLVPTGTFTITGPSYSVSTISAS